MEWALKSSLMRDIIDPKWFNFENAICFGGWKILKELEDPVEHIILPTFSYDHNFFVVPFSRKFPWAKIWVAPSQWSWPINLPLEIFEIFSSRIFPNGDILNTWFNEIEEKVLSSPEVGKLFLLYSVACSEKFITKVNLSKISCYFLLLHCKLFLF